MDGIALGTPPRFRVAIPCFSSSRFRRRLLSLDPAPGFPMDRPRRPCALRCTTAEEASETEEECDPPTSGGQNIANSVEIKEWQNGNVVDNAASRQGIQIRRRPLTGPPKHYVGPFEFRLENEGNTPRNILEKIIWDKDMEVSQLKERRPLTTLKKALEDAPPVRDFVGALKASVKNTGMPALIAEVKKASPSRGVLRENFDPVKIASAYEKFGATCISVLTDEKYFQGSFENLEAIRRAGVKCPLLCKEFIIDAWQIYYARSKGADAILLIAAVLPDLDIKYLTKICRLLGLATLVEVHNEREMDRVLSIEGIQLIGINNRDLETFQVDISNTKRLLEGEHGELIRQRDIISLRFSVLWHAPAMMIYQHSMCQMATNSGWHCPQCLACLVLAYPPAGGRGIWLIHS